MFDLNQLRCFVTVAEELHFGRAAVRLNMTQPPLSRQIQVLEHIIDAPLLERTSRSVRLTPAGRSFLPEARRILKLAESASQVARRIAMGKTGSLKIGYTAAAAYGFLPELIAACCGRRSPVPSWRPGACSPSRCLPRSRRSTRWRRRRRSRSRISTANPS
jgi:DNA-binding transcriptional LysR family regulator